MDETRYNQDREMVREAVRVSGDPQKPPSARKNHLPVIAIPAVIALVFILYKPISSALSRAGFSSVTRTASSEELAEHPAKERKTVYSPVIIVAAILAVASLAFFFVKLGGSFTFG